MALRVGVINLGNKNPNVNMNGDFYLNYIFEDFR